MDLPLKIPLEYIHFSLTQLPKWSPNHGQLFYLDYSKRHISYLLTLKKISKPVFSPCERSSKNNNLCWKKCPFAIRIHLKLHNLIYKPIQETCHCLPLWLYLVIIHLLRCPPQSLWTLSALSSLFLLSHLQTCPSLWLGRPPFPAFVPTDTF